MNIHVELRACLTESVDAVNHFSRTFLLAQLGAETLRDLSQGNEQSSMANM